MTLTMADLLDELLRDVQKIPANMTIRFGPGIFRTRGGLGSSHPTAGWLPRSGQKFIGSGMYQTVLQLADTAYDTLGRVPPDRPGEKIPIFGNGLPILKLPARYALVLNAVDLDGREPKQVAEELELSWNNLNVRLYRARTALRKRLEETCQACSVHGCLDCTCK